MCRNTDAYVTYYIDIFVLSLESDEISESHKLFIVILD